MKTGLTKKQKTTSIFFDEASDMVEICTYNTDLKNRITAFLANYPNEGRLIDDDELGCKTFEVKKGRFGFKMTAPYSEERRKAAGELAKQYTKKLRRHDNENPVL